DPALKHVVLVALTGYGRPEDKAQALAAGFDYHLAKPVDLDALGNLVARLGSRLDTDGSTTRDLPRASRSGGSDRSQSETRTGALASARLRSRIPPEHRTAWAVILRALSPAPLECGIRRVPPEGLTCDLHKSRTRRWPPR